MKISRHVACDLGAESGRLILGSLQGHELKIDEVHRFPNGPSIVNDSRRWNVLGLFEQICAGLKKIAAFGWPVESVSTDSWGVDYVYLFANEPFLTAPYQYRDKRLVGAFERAFPIVPSDEIFDETGIQLMEINTLYQLHHDLVHRTPVMEMAERFLTIADYFNYLLSGVGVIEESLASTTQLYNPVARAWSEPLREKFGFPRRLFPKVVPSGTVLGPLLPEYGREKVYADTKIVATCSHDTGAAIAAVPAEGEDWAYISSGTWSLLGIESPKPIITPESRACNFTNEIGYGGSIRFLKNIVGLWIVQECRRAWAAEGREYDYDELTRLAEAAPPLQSLIQPSAARFNAPGAMPQKIADYCAATNQTPPSDVGATVRCILESLSLLYAKTLHDMEAVTLRQVNRLHIVGGGSKNQLLNQLAADACQVVVLAGPVEATAIGNILIQALALGHLKSLAELRSVVRESFPLQRFSPATAAMPAWSDARQRFARLTLLD